MSRKDKDLVQMGIVIKPELREWFVNKCSQARTNEDRIVSISTVLSYYLERLKELDDLDPFNTCPILKRDSYPLPAEKQPPLETASAAINWSEIVNPLKAEMEKIKSKFDEIPNYRQELAQLEEKLNQTIDDKISEVFSKLPELLNLITNTNTSDEAEEEIRESVSVSNSSRDGEEETNISNISVSKVEEIKPQEQLVEKTLDPITNDIDSVSNSDGGEGENITNDRDSVNPAEEIKPQEHHTEETDNLPKGWHDKVLEEIAREEVMRITGVTTAVQLTNLRRPNKEGISRLEKEYNIIPKKIDDEWHYFKKQSNLQLSL